MSLFPGQQIRQFTIEETLTFVLHRRARWSVDIDYPDLSEFGCHGAPRQTIMIFYKLIPSLATMTVPLLLAPMLYCVVYPWTSSRTWKVTSCTSRMSVPWRLSNASNIALLVGGVIPFMFKVAILIETFRYNCRGVWVRGGGLAVAFILCPYEFAQLSFYSLSVPAIFQRFFPILSFIWAWVSSRIVCL